MTDPLPAVWARGLVRRFGASVAVDGLDLAILPGEFYGLLGPNGAGKTTTIRMITGLLRPSEGAAGVGPHDTWKRPLEVKRRIGFLPEELHLYDRLTGAELVDFASAIHGVEPAEARRRRQELLRALDLEDAAHHLVADYSRGMRKKTGLAAALVHSPPVLFLDEPFEGVDPVSARLIRGLLRRYVERKGTVVLSSHSMDVVDRLCTRVGIMLRGRLVAEGEPEELRETFEAGSIEEVFLRVVGATEREERFEWLGSSSA